MSRQEAEPPHAIMYDRNTGHATPPHCCSSPTASHDRKQSKTVIQGRHHTQAMLPLSLTTGTFFFFIVPGLMSTDER